LSRAPIPVFTLLGPNDVPGLSIRTQSGKWIDAPALRGAFIANGGQLLQRWTNDYFLATANRAINRSGGERYALAFFCDRNIDWPVATMPTCVRGTESLLTLSARAERNGFRTFSSRAR
jgi:isopenicillin N synthase-like dioxygenase